MDTYDYGKMKKCGADILSELSVFNNSKNEADEIVQRLRNNMQSDVNTAYTRKYNEEAKVAAENVAKLMKQFAELLTVSGDKFEGIEKGAKSALG